LAPGRGVKAAYDIVRRHVPRLSSDRSMSAGIQLIVEAIRQGEFEALLS
jgi:histidine ammonia-lyase